MTAVDVIFIRLGTTPNPGPCSAGTAILIPNSTQHVELTQPLSNRGSILLGKLVAIKLVIDFLIIPNNRKNTESIKIFSDSQSAIGILTLNWKSDNYGKTIHDIKICILALKSEGIIVSSSLNGLQTSIIKTSHFLYELNSPYIHMDPWPRRYTR